MKRWNKFNYFVRRQLRGERWWRWATNGHIADADAGANVIIIN